MKLTKYEQEIYYKLCEQGRIYWSHTVSQETRALKRLVKKGVATYNSGKKMWESVKEKSHPVG